MNQNLSEEMKSYLRGLNYVSIHAPMLFGDSFIPYFGFDVSALEKLYNDLNAKAIVFHPHQKIPRVESEMQFCVENVPNFKFGEFDIMKTLAESKLREFPQLKFVLDSCHAFHYPNYLEEMVNKYQDRIQHIHLSDRRYNHKKGKIEDHQTFAGCLDKKKFDCLKVLDCPMIIEISTQQNLNTAYFSYLREEIDCVREFFGS